MLADISTVAKPGQVNQVVVKINNELNETSLPCGATKILNNGRKLAKPYFDFFNYSGLQRSVWVIALPEESVKDYSVDYELCGTDALVKYEVVTTGEHPVIVRLLDAEGELVAETEGKEGILQVANARLWEVRNAYLYQIVILITDGNGVLDEYREKIGIRTVRIEGTKILLMIGRYI